MGRSRFRPDRLYANRAHDFKADRITLRLRGIAPKIPRRNTEHGSDLGIYRWVVERTLSWIHQQRRLRIRFERRADIHEGFMRLTRALICWRALGASLCYAL